MLFNFFSLNKRMGQQKIVRVCKKNIVKGMGLEYYPKPRAVTQSGSGNAPPLLNTKTIGQYGAYNVRRLPSGKILG